MKTKIKKIFGLCINVLRNIDSVIYPYISTDLILSPVYFYKYTYKYEHGTKSITRLYILCFRVYESEVSDER